MFRRTQLKAVSFWSIPLIYAAGGLALGAMLPRMELVYFRRLAFTVNVDSARAIFSSVASGTIALTAIVFSLAFVMTQFSAIAYSPRLVSWISQDPVLQHALGIFTSTFLYAITALAWIGRTSATHVPFITAWMVIVLLVASIIVFMRLMQRLSLLQVSRVLRSTGDRGRQVIETMYPQSASKREEADNTEFQRVPISQRLVHCGRPRIIQAINVLRLVALASSVDGIIEMNAAVGDSVVEGTSLLVVRGASRQLKEGRLRRAIQTGNERTFEQDPKYAIRLLVDIAIRALSPAVNDPTTAVQALDEIEDLLHRLGTRQLEVESIRDDKGNLRLVTLLPTWDDILRLALDEIRLYGATSIQTMRRMKALARGLIEDLPEKREGMLHHYMDRIDATIARSFPDPEDRAEAATEDRQGLGVHRRQSAMGN